MDDAKMSTEQVEETRFAAAQAEFGHHQERILVLQGGGALGAYQAGVYQGLAAAGFAPSWVAGTSIGAINAALIAGNQPDRRVARLSEFWDRVSGGRFAVVPPAGMDFMRPWLNRMSAAAVATFGVAGFFSPRFPPPALAPDGSVGALSFYDTEPLRETLNELVDFDLVNSGKVRLSLGAVNVRTGESIYFDTTTHKIDAGHVMASGSLPPGFPPVKIDGEWYWDGGLMSNTPLLHVAQDLRIDALVIQVDLFSGLGDMPTNIEEVCERAKDIQYQSKRRLSMEMMRHLEGIRSTLAEVLEMLPEAKKSDPRVQKLSTVSRRGALSLVHLVNRHDTQSSNFKDYEFSRATVMDLWRAGRDDIHRAMTNPRSGRVTDIGSGVRFFDF
jgi:NTE family protein